MKYIFENTAEKEILALRNSESEVGENVAKMPGRVKIETKINTAVFAGLCFLALMVPFGFGHPQWLVGTIVNACLFLGALLLPKKYWIALIIFPSLGVLSRGLIFGPLTFFLIYFLPFIWTGNWMLMIVFYAILKKVRIARGSLVYIFGVVFAGGAKFLFLFLAANVYFNFKIVPKLFLASMGSNQFSTALAGGIISFLIFKAIKIWKNRI